MIHLIAAIDFNNGIGYKNKLLCHLPNDLKHFKELTAGHFVVMGANTFKSIGKSLPNRQNIVLTRKMKHDLPRDVYVYHSVKDILHEYENYAEKEIELFIIGGQSIYEQFLPHADKIHLTIIENEFEKVDSYFPQFSLEEWIPIKSIRNWKDENNLYNYSFVTYERRNLK